MSLNHSENRSESAAPVSVEAHRQGIQGVVRRLTGNQMPGIGDRANGGSIEPVQTTVWVFAGRIPGHGSPQWVVDEARQHPHLVERAESDANGQFFVQLPPGEYTVFAQYENFLYLNAFEGDGSYATVRVEPGQVTNLSLDHTEAAAF